ncbi:MAG: SH3 domain-containing protein, partial [Clostridia bacterium]|nr:SH3 domain-containing protein [Clostridia bacterium]
VISVRSNGGFDTNDTVSTVSSIPAKTDEIIQKEVVSTPAESEKITSSDDTVSVREYTATMYTTSKDLNVRSEPDSNNKPLGTLALGAAVKVTGKYANGWYRIDYNGQTAYCFGKYLSDKKVGKDENKPAKINTPYLIKVNRAQNMLIIYKKDDNGEYTVPVKAMVCSVGRAGHETPKGTYKLSDKYTWGCLSGNVWGQYVTRITGPYLFHSVPYFTRNKGNLEYEEYNKLGQAASKGCVRLCVADAKWIFDNCAKGTTVTIYDSSEPEPLTKPTPVTIDTNDGRKGWDPTDPDKENPWKK